MPIALILAAALAQSSAGATFDLTIPPGANFDKAEFRLWYAPSTPTVQATLVLVPASNGDGRPIADDPFWQAFAARHHVALVACRFTDKPHDQPFTSTASTGELNYEFVAWKPERVKARTFRPAAEAPPQAEGTAWLPTSTVAKAWEAVATGQPFSQQSSRSRVGVLPS